MSILKSVVSCILLVLFFASQSQASDLPDLSGVDPRREEEIRRIMKWCEQTDIMDEEYYLPCRQVFYCGDGGCDSSSIRVFVYDGRETEFLNKIAQMPVEGMRRCSEDERFPMSFVPQNAEKQGADFNELLKFCGETRPGFEAPVTLALRQLDDVVFGAERTGGAAGGFHTAIDIDRDQFLRIRDGGLGDVRSLLKQVLENILKTECITDAKKTCALNVSSGRLKLELLIPGDLITGRNGFWEHSYFDIYPAMVSDE